MNKGAEGPYKKIIKRNSATRRTHEIIVQGTSEYFRAYYSRAARNSRRSQTVTKRAQASNSMHHTKHKTQKRRRNNKQQKQHWSIDRDSNPIKNQKILASQLLEVASYSVLNIKVSYDVLSICPLTRRQQ